MKYELEVSCGFCPESHEVEIDLPDGWATRYAGSSDETGFCPKHSPIAPFADSQCRGCVGGWGECGLWQSFAYSDRRTLSPGDLDFIRSGVCPKRVNGALVVDRRGVTDVDISNRATTESGEALAKAILEYWERYPECAG